MPVKGKLGIKSGGAAACRTPSLDSTPMIAGGKRRPHRVPDDLRRWIAIAVFARLITLVAARACAGVSHLRPTFALTRTMTFARATLILSSPVDIYRV